MKLVIDIPENLYKAAINGLNAEEIWDLRVAIKNGAPLPKVHGRLIDADELIEGKVANDWTRIQAECAPTIIEADGGDAE